MTDHGREQRAPATFPGTPDQGPETDLQTFLDHVNGGGLIRSGSQLHRFMHRAAQDALRIVAEMNTGYRTPEDVRELLAELTGKPVDATVTVFPPFYSEFGKNLTLGKNVFINLDAASRTPEASRSETARSSATAAP